MLIIPPTLLPSIIAAITKVATTVGPMITKYAPIVIKTLGENLPKMIQLVEAVSLAANVLKPNDKVEELGAKAMAADKKPEDFDKINDYINYLRNEVEVDEATLSQDPIDKTVRQAIGTSIALKALGSELNTDISLPFLSKVSELGLESKVILEIIKSYAKSGLTPDDVEAYIDGDLTLDESKKHSNILVDAYHNAYPSMTSQEIEQAVMKDF
ncbi:hypothetical protein A6E05_16375 [Aliivibrio sp. 1S165]|uniref:hypothetical protein n=1 Tax=unclassified Aliivibrio TaxID=2645654 RepID=UPI00080E6CC2|nr:MULTISPECIES: hypothetical protein [unclassified Aliivibrio]OCH16458.1 hypothetical protein A6E05_16375 [Aliivibrio sp. 1S165]OCH33895.1 hypothetical protein A6E06_17005 [Aliivibrio sp. 1S175]